MPLQNHLAELERKHQVLERQLAEAIAHTSTDDLTVAELKRKKLQLKDEITKLRAQSTQVTH